VHLTLRMFLPQIVRKDLLPSINCLVHRSGRIPSILALSMTIRGDICQLAKTGVISISSTLTADEDALAVTMIAWGLWGLPENVFAGAKACLSVEGIGLQGGRSIS